LTANYEADELHQVSQLHNRLTGEQMS